MSFFSTTQKKKQAFKQPKGGKLGAFKAKGAAKGKAGAFKKGGSKKMGIKALAKAPGKRKKAAPPPIGPKRKQTKGMMTPDLGEGPPPIGPMM